MTNNPISLYELNSMVAMVIEHAMPKRYWVEAEVSEARESRGHLYIELIQKDDHTHTPIARASAKCWRTSWTLIAPHFERITGTRLKAGIKIMALVHPQFHPQYGFSWIVDDINPEYTMGDMARKRQEIIAQLKQEGVFDLQKELVLPLFAQRIAVISSASAAGYGDFCNQLLTNEYRFDFHTELFAATMQGEQIENSVVNALNAINEREDEFDCVVIIRGGGATADLSGFDTLQLAENVANFPIPIITGIGHERDESILDMVAHTSVKTPTAVAAFLIENLSNTLRRIDNAQNIIYRAMAQKMQHEKMRLEQLSTAIPMLFTMVKSKEEAQLDKYLHALSQHITSKLLTETMKIELLSNRIKPAIERHLTYLQHRIDLIEQRIELVNPERLLSLGYSITYCNGKVIRNEKELKAGDEITTRVMEGEIKSIVTK
ncbi:exodeoxyribonuclease VII large subunit [Prevotella ihumii]|uniref:exodeoxyribonuclease VII large subunit n=1 Tax=Prevotella ihumii TaxID=1917878 RepID=UPI0009822757|nr:exodeoxyribonuclease VII large subunit [Prevotella ihumii]